MPIGGFTKIGNTILIMHDKWWEIQAPLPPHLILIDYSYMLLLARVISKCYQ